ncbi:DUF2207 domain-containing protein, partial [Candidatus Saccharibacteria bacterium]|nr:DUF2207 domain-containing protein [Candidatus Saccharibacteria bacterium]
MSIIKKTITTLIITFITVFSNIQSVSALDTNNFYFKDATFDYYLEKTDTGSNLHVKEVLTAVFPDSNQNHGITRTIPFTNQGGKNITAESEDALNLTVTRNDNYEPISKTEKNNNGYYTFYIGDSSTYVHGEQVYTLEYDFSNVITEFTADGQMTWNGKDAATQELYWDTNGTGWFQKFNHLTANLHLPTDIAKNLGSGTSCYVGSYGASNNGSDISSHCKVSSNDETTYNTSAANSSLAKSAETVITFETSNLSAGENLTFAVAFAAGTFIVPQPKQSYTLLIFSIVIVTLCMLIIVMAAGKYQKSVKEKKSYNKGLFVKPEYVPPKGLTVAEAGEIYIKSSKPSFV